MLDCQEREHSKCDRARPCPAHKFHNVSRLASYTANPSLQHISALKRILRHHRAQEPMAKPPQYCLRVHTGISSTMMPMREFLNTKTRPAADDGGEADDGRLWCQVGSYGDMVTCDDN